MAVFTPVSHEQTQALLANYSIGELRSLTGISAGIENTNYFLDTDQGHFVLTIFEVLKRDQVPFYVELMHWLAQNKVPVPLPQTRHDGQRISLLAGKPAIIVTKLPGQWVRDPSVQHCQLAAQTMGHIHLAGAHFAQRQPNLRGLSWWQTTAPGLMQFLSPAQQTMLNRALAHQTLLSESGQLKDLPSGPAHCDYFRDNVLFAENEGSAVMGGVIDFYFAGCDHWLFDVAVAVNDWCIDRSTGCLDELRTRAWLDAYRAVRPFTADEQRLWPDMLEAAALRFWISRLYDYFLPRPAQSLKPHDPSHFERILTLRMSGRPPSLLGHN
jgi:homoserine kinase type II